LLTINRGSFAACFSGTGKYLAIGTQSASISIFDVAALTVPGVDPLLTTFSASRPSLEYGAVRDMAFAPGYSDLLAWTEDRDRVGIADLRNGYVSRQIISLSNRDDFDHVGIHDKSTVDPRLLEARASDTLSSNFASALDISPDSRPSATTGPRDIGSSRYHVPLTSEETLVLEALQEHRRRQELRELREARAQGGGTSSPGPRSPWADHLARSGPTSDSPTWSANPRSRAERSASTSRTVNDIMNDIRNQRERMRDQERLRGPMRDDSTAATDRRRAPIPPSTWRVPLPASLVSQSGLAPSERRSLRSALDSTYAELANYSQGQASYNTRNGSNNNSNNGGTSGTGESSSSPSPYDGYRPNIENDVRRRDRAAYLMRDWEDPGRRIDRFFPRGGEPAPPHPYDTSGLAWSADGQIL